MKKIEARNKMFQELRSGDLGEKERLDKMMTTLVLCGNEMSQSELLHCLELCNVTLCIDTIYYLNHFAGAGVIIIEEPNEIIDLGSEAYLEGKVDETTQSEMQKILDMADRWNELDFN